jgi:hypothetical protein
MAFRTVNDFLEFFKSAPADQEVDVWLGSIGTSASGSAELGDNLAINVSVPDGYVLLAQWELDRLKGNEPAPKQPEIVPQIRDFEGLVSSTMFALASSDGFKLDSPGQPEWNDYLRRARAACMCAADGDQLRCAYPTQSADPKITP